MKWKLFALILILSILLIPTVALADSPQPDVQPWMYAAIQTSGLGTVQNVQAAFGNYQNEQARIHNYNTPEKWQSNYAADVTTFLHLHGCASCNIDGTTQSFKLKIDEPIYMRDFGVLRAE